MSKLSQENTLRICVIGAGPAGLTTIKQLRDEGHEVVCFERNSSIGGIWSRHPGDDRETKAYDEVMLSISLKLMSFSDLMVEDRRFVGRQGYMDYLRRYAETYGLERHIEFETEVVSVSHVGGQWHVSVKSDGESIEHVF